jgi:methionine aminotransferase
MSKMAAEHNAINLSQRFPDFPVDERLTNIIARLANKNVRNIYTNGWLPPLLEKVAALVKSSYGRII